MLLKMLFKYGKQRWSLLWTLLLIFQLYDNGVSGAPTKHLKITAKGDTPRLIVTSEEDFGTEPKRLVAANSKNYKTTMPILPTPTQTPTPTLLAKKQDIVDKSYETELVKKLQIATSTTTTDKLLFNKNAEGKDFATTEEYKYALGETTTTTKTTLPLIPKNTILKHQYATTSNMLQQHQIETTTISLLEQIMQSEKTQEPIQIKNVNKSIKESIYDTTTPATTTTIVNSMIEKMPKKKNQMEQQKQQQQQEEEVTPVVQHELLTMEENKKYISTTMEMPITQVATTTTTTTLKPVTNIAVIDKLNDKMMISNSEKTATATASTHTPQVEHIDKHVNFKSANSTIVSVATLTDKHEEHDVTVRKTTPTTTDGTILPKLTTTLNPKPNKYEGSIKVATTANTKPSGSGSGSGIVATTKVPSFYNKDDVMLNDQSRVEDAGEAVRLLDLEKHEPKSFAFERKHQSTKAAVADVDVLTALDFDGHDGIKKTKKKQLKIDKHMLADIGIEYTPTSTTTTYKAKKSGKTNKTKFLPDISSLATHSLGPIHMDEKVFSVKELFPKPQESKISDIQVEIYESTVDSILATALKASTTKTPTVPELQEKFTQYVVDRVESSTSESNSLPTMSSRLSNFGKPEPAAIEIHINVSEGVGNGSEDLEFSYPQTNFEAHEAPLKSLKVSHSKAKNSSNPDEILVVEIIDAGDNSTDNTISAENIHPVFTFRTDQSVNEIEFKDNIKTSKAQQTDELFMAEVKPDVSVAPPIVQRPAVEHDSDTIFYISNTEVKVGESPTLANMKTNANKSKQKSKLNAAYSLSTHPNSARYEEDILLSPLQNTADSLKIFRSQNEENSPPLDVTYVGESVMEVEQLPPEEKEQSDVSVSQQVGTTSTSAPSHVIIQPATLSEIGVPVIGELPPQIELKEFDFMPDELTNHEQHSGSMSGAEEESGHVGEEQTLVGNDVERLVESSIQYGGDLIDEGAVDNGGGFDGAEGSYPFGNLATMGRHGRQNAKRKQGAHFNVHHGVNNLRKDELSVDINGRDGGVAAAAADEAAMQLNGTLKYAEQTMHNVSDATMNITFAVAERMTNGTLASLMENPKRKSLNVNDEYYLSMVSLTGSVIIATLPVITIFALFCTLRYFYHQYRSHANEDDNAGVSQQAKIDGSGEHGSASSANAGNSQSTLLQTQSSSAKRNLEIALTTNSTLVDEQKPKSIPSSGEAENKHIELTEAPNRNCLMNTHNFFPISKFTNLLPSLEFKGPNGSVTKMTLKNNQLIIETEERNDISRNARETKMHYNNSTGKDGVFVVEVSRGADSQQIPESPLSETAATFIQTLTTTNASMSATKPNSFLEKNEKSPILQEEVQVHEPPKDVEDNKKLNQIPEVEEEKTDMLRSNTGLSQSDLSLSSSSHSNKAYTYGNQTLYGEDTSKVIKLQTEMTPSQLAAAEPNKPNQNMQNEGNYENAFNDMNIGSNMVEEKQKETIANEAIEMDNKLQMQVTTEPVVGPEHNIEINNASDIVAQNAEIAVTTLGETETIGKQENMEKCINANAEDPVFDSLMSLPEPPSYEEINQIGVSVVGDTAQLDSLPPPPPPALFVAEQAEHIESDDTVLDTVENGEALQQYALNNIKILPPPPSCTTPEIELNNGKEQLLSTQLTPPESPPGANCANNRGKAAGICLPLPALAVNVNGS